MTHYFNATLNCGSGETDARTLGEAFDGWTIAVAPGVSTRCDVMIRPGLDGNWQVLIGPHGAWYGRRDTRPELLGPEARWTIAAAIFERLRTFRGYLLGCVGWETQDFIDLAPDGAIEVAPGTIIRADLAERAGDPSLFEPFSAEYLWRPVTAETLPRM